MPNLLEGLNNEQLKAVTHKGGPLLIVAGAGTGKTTVVTRRIAYLIEQKLAKPEEILALTFTEKAASEMEERVDLLMPLGYVDLWISTFHSFCERILKLHALDIGLPNDFELLDETKQWILIHKNLDKFELDYYRPLGNPSKFIAALLQHFSRCKDELITPKDYLQYAEQMKLSLDNPDFAFSSSRASLSFPRRRESKAAFEGGMGPRIREDDNASDDHTVTELKRTAELADAYHIYQKLLLDNDYLDFGDLINYTLDLFKRRPNILEFYRRKFKYILVDEFQDTNFAQYELVKLLAQPPREEMRNENREMSQQNLISHNSSLISNLNVVGDDDQSIYKFRGASVSNILKFKDEFPSLTQITLTTNYRSSQEILDLAYKLIQHNNPDRLEVKLGIDKRLINPNSTLPSLPYDRGGTKKASFPDSNDAETNLAGSPPKIGGARGGMSEGEIKVLEGKDLSDELNLVVKKLLEIKKQTSESSWNDFAILIRSRNASDEILPRLEAAGIPFTYVANTGLYKKELIANLLSYFKLLDNYHESSSLYRILNFPRFALPAQDLAYLVQYTGVHTLSLYETLHEAKALEKISEESKKKLQTLLALLETHTQLAKERNAVEMLVTVVKDLYVVELLEAETLENAQNRELLEQFYKKVESHEQDKTNPDKTIRGFLFAVDLELRAGNDGDIKFDPNLGPESLKVLTVHAAKGLEFENVFVVNLVDQRFPTREKNNGIEIPEKLIKDILPEGDFHLQEERRLFYVAITRAKKRLYLTWSKDYGGSRTKKPSIFLQETELVPSEKVTKATGKVVFTRPEEHPKRQVYQELPKIFSYSAIMTFLQCPLDYKYAHYLKLPLPGSPQLSFGVTIHATLQKYLEEYQRSIQSAQIDLFGKTAKPALPSLERLLEVYHESWVDEWYPDKKSKEGYREKGKEQLKVFFDYSLNHIPQPKYIEKRFNLKLGEFIFTGKIDRVDSMAEGASIIDYKTGNPPKKKGDEDLDQLRIYQWACEEQFKEKVTSLCYWYLDKNEFREVEVAAGSELALLQEKLLATIHDIRDAVKFDRFSDLHKKAKQHFCGYEDYL